MQNRTFVVVLTGLVALLCLYYLSFTFVSRNYKQQATDFATDPKTGQVDLLKRQRFVDSLWKEKVYLGSTLKEVTERELNLGLDLQGGMHVMLEVSPVEIVRSLSGNSQNPKFIEALNKAKQEQQAGARGSFVDIFYRNWQDVSGGQKLNTLFSNAANRGKITYQTSDADVIRVINEEVEGAIDRAFKIIQTRVDKFGVTNPNLQRIPGTGRIQVELAGVDNPERVRKLLSGAAKLEFAEVYELQDYAAALDQLGTYLTRIEAEEKAATQTAAPTTQGLAGLGKTAASAADTVKADDGGLAGLGGKARTDTAKAKAKTDTAKAQQPTGLASLFVPMGNGSLGVFVKDTPRVNRILARPEVAQLFPSDLDFAYDVKAISATDGKDLVGLTAVKRGQDGKTALDGDVISDASQDFDQSNRVEVSMNMNAEGARRWKTLTANNVGRRVAILLDGYVQSAPVVNGEIPNGRSSITGSFTIEEGKDLANVLKAGKLPAPTSIVEEAVVGSTLGAEAVSSGVLSSVVGFIVVLLFMVAYYSKAGWVANAALLINLFFLMGIMASLGAVLTLPGIAGIVLTIGMSVDANVLIYERIKEELALGKSYPQAIADGFKNAYSSIIDSNATTLLTGIVLLVFGTGLILGFATTLVIGIFTSLFAAIFISRAILDWTASKGWRFGFSSSLTKNLFKDSQFDFVSRRKLYYTISSIIIAAGVVSILIKGFGLGVDFKGGRTYVARFQNDVKTEDVRQALTVPFGAAPEVKTYGVGKNQVLITTSYLADQSTPESDVQATAKLKEGLGKLNGNTASIESSSKVGPTIAQDMIWSSVKAILLAIAITFGYILLRFKKLAFGYGALVALFHDVLIILSIFSIFNGLLPFSLDVDQSFVAAVLTIMGYSMNDTVVVFDRVREYLADNRGKRESIPTVINNALNSTLSRTAVTGISTMLVLLILFIFGGEVIRGFSFAMLIGVIVGTYSSLFVATPIVVDSLSRDKSYAEPTVTPAPATPAVAAAPKGKLKPQA
jgi:SecD/SecF fusion protein